MDDPRETSAADLGRAIGAGTLDPVALTETFLDAARAHPHRGAIYARLTEDRALAEAHAAQARARAGTRRGPLDGVPISWKDLYDSAGTATEGGSALLKGRVPDRDAEILRNATAAGLVCLGKTHLSELAFSGLGFNPRTGTPPNRNDPEAVPGGSSSGAAASVASGLAAAAIGSDTGGSIRLPAAWNDLVGFKPAHGALSMAGALPLCPKFDTAGPLARSVEDAALLFAVLAGRAAPDLAGARIEGTRLLLLGTDATDGLEPQVARGFDTAVERLAAAGARIERRELPLVTRAAEQSATVFAAEAYGTWRETIEANPEAMYHQVRTRFRAGGEVSAADYVAAWHVLDAARRDYARETAGFDAVILPTCPILPPKRAAIEADDAHYVERNLMTLRNTRIGNLLGLAGVTLPTGVPSVGILFQGAAGSEARLLRLCHAAERVLT